MTPLRATGEASLAPPCAGGDVVDQSREARRWARAMVLRATQFPTGPPNLRWPPNALVGKRELPLLSSLSLLPPGQLGAQRRAS